MRPALVAAVLALAIAPQAEGRDFDVAAGIQYVIQGSKEGKRTFEETGRIFAKAVLHLNKGLVNDPSDGEGWIYLGLAYGELDSLEQAGKTFAEAIRRVQDNPKLLKRATDYRDYYFVATYNYGLLLYRDAMNIMATEDLPDSTDKATKARAKLAEAESKFRAALMLNPERALGYDKLATMLELQGKVDQAGLVIERGLANSMPKEGEEYERLLKRKAR